MPITKNTSIEKVIKDFVESDDTRFDGKSKEERINMAKGAYYSMQKESINIKENEMSLEKLISQISENQDEAKDTIEQMLLNKMAEKLEGMKESAMKDILTSVTLEEATRKDFQATADIVKTVKDPETRQALANAHAQEFAKGNPRFNHSLFHKACGTSHGI